MSRLQYIITRWRYVRELADPKQRVEKFKTTIQSGDAVSDVDYLIKEVQRLQEDLKDARNPFSSRLGPLVDFEDGETKYMIEGQYRPAHTIQKAMYFLREIYKGHIKKVTKEVLKRVEEILREANYEEDPQNTFKG